MTISKPKIISSEARSPQVQNAIENISSFKSENLTVLQAYLDKQIETNVYDNVANMALLKLYQLNPQEANIDEAANYVGKALIKALIAVPEPDFDLCWSLLGPSFIELPLIKSLITLQQTLESANFVLFWSILAASCPKFVPFVSASSAVLPKIEPLDPAAARLILECKGFVSSVRDFIAVAVGITYRSIDIQRLGTYFNAKDGELDELIKHYKWSFDMETKLVNLPVWSETKQLEEILVSQPNVLVKKQATMTSIREELKLEQLIKVIGYSHSV